MNKILLALIALGLAGLFSCAKTHYSNPTPANVQLQSVEVVSQVNGGQALHELYSIFYDGQKRVSQFIYTTDDSSYSKKVITFTYNATLNKIYKNYYFFKHDSLYRTDSFQTNFSGQIIEEWVPGSTTTFAYTGTLLYELNSFGTTPTLNGSTEYTSHNGDFYKSNSTISNDSSQFFSFYETLPMRPGDYLWLRSFLNFGMNIYANANLVRTAVSSGYTNNITYSIDGQSKIIQTCAVISDTVGDTYTYTYNLAYVNN